MTHEVTITKAEYDRLKEIEDAATEFVTWMEARCQKDCGPQLFSKIFHKIRNALK